MFRLCRVSKEMYISKSKEALYDVREGDLGLGGREEESITESKFIVMKFQDLKKIFLRTKFYQHHRLNLMPLSVHPSVRLSFYLSVYMNIYFQLYKYIIPNMIRYDLI